MAPCSWRHPVTGGRRTIHAGAKQTGAVRRRDDPDARPAGHFGGARR